MTPVNNPLAFILNYGILWINENNQRVKNVLIKSRTCIYLENYIFYMVTNQGCLSGCGDRGGRCEYCGKGGHCCRRGRNDCPIEQANIAPTDRHVCIRSIEIKT